LLSYIASEIALDVDNANQARYGLNRTQEASMDIALSFWFTVEGYSKRNGYAGIGAPRPSIGMDSAGCATSFFQLAAKNNRDRPG